MAISQGKIFKYFIFETLLLTELCIIKEGFKKKKNY